MKERLPACHLKILPAYETICMQKTYRGITKWWCGVD